MITTKPKTQKTKSSARNEMVDLAGHSYDAGAAALKLAKRIAKLINIETKFFDFTTSQTPTFSGTIDWVTNVIQGVGISQRVGDSLRAQSFEICWTASMNSLETKNTVLRYLLVKDYENQGSVPAVVDIIEVAGSSTNILSPPDFINRNRFAIVDDVMVQLDNSGENALVYRKKYPINNHLKYRGTAGTAADLAEGNLFVLFLSDENGNNPSVKFYSRLVYTDD
jgi:hypothetical protein